MEVRVLKTFNIPDKAFLSVRSGATRRQAQVSLLEKPLSFPKAPDENTTFKVDVLDLVGSGRLAYNPTETEYMLPIESLMEDGSLTNMEIMFAVRPTDGAAAAAGPIASEGEADPDEKREQNARDYLEKHGLVTFMHFLMQSLMKDKPAEPYTFLQKQCTMRMVTEVQEKAARGEPLTAADRPAEAPEGLMAGQGDSASLEQLNALRNEASAAGERLREDNEQLRATAAGLRNEYQGMLDRVGKENVPLDEHGIEIPQTKPMPPEHCNEAPQIAAYREIARVQDEVTHLAKENAGLVNQLAQMRALVDAIRLEMADLNS